jgi:thiamine-monophosphate kinase
MTAMLEDIGTSASSVSQLGEHALIGQVAALLQSTHPTVHKGIGDDCAVLDGPDGQLLLVTTDSLVEHVHFDRVYVPAAHLGYKAAMVNISDIHGMNGKPTALLLSLSLPVKVSTQFVTDFIQGFEACCAEHGAQLVGGDTTGSKAGIAIGVTAMGLVKPEQVTYRSGATAGDFLCLSGDLGAAYAGLLLLEREKQVFLENPGVQPDFAGFQYVLGRQLKPASTRTVLDLLQAAEVVPTAMIDVSDGLASESLHLAKASNCHIRLFEDKLPIDFETLNALELFSIEPMYAALHGGEDYELLFTVKAADVPMVKQLPGITIIGHVQEGAGTVDIVRADTQAVEVVERLGFSHFDSPEA